MVVGDRCAISHLQFLLNPQTEPVVYAVNIGQTQFLGSLLHHLEVNQITDMTSDFIIIPICSLLANLQVFSVNEGVCSSALQHCWGSYFNVI